MTDEGRWNRTAVIDRSLWSPAEPADSQPDLPALMHRGGARIRAVTFPGLPPPSAVFLDRDGTLIVDRHYLREASRVTLLQGVSQGLRALAERGLPLVVVTNQSGVGLGLVTHSELEAIHARLLELLARHRIPLAGIYTCPHRNDAGCDCRKPGDGLVREAVRDLGLSLGQAVLAGDKPTDLALARRLGLTAFLVTTGHGAATLRDQTVTADYVVDGLDQMASICLHPAGRAAAAALPEH